MMLGTMDMIEAMTRSGLPGCVELVRSVWLMNWITVIGPSPP